MTADEYGFRPLPPDGLTIRQKVALFAMIVVAGLLLTTVALHLQQRAEQDRFDRLWIGQYAWPERYHLIAATDTGEQWEVWFEAPNRWAMRLPGGAQVSDGTTVTTYTTDGNFYTTNAVSATYLQLDIGPLGPRDPAELKRVLRNAESIGSGWSVTHDSFLGMEVDLVQIGRSTGGNTGIVRTLVIDPKRMFLLRESVGNLEDDETFIAATNVEYEVEAPAGTFAFSLPTAPASNPPSMRRAPRRIPA